MSIYNKEELSATIKKFLEAEAHLQNLRCYHPLRKPGFSYELECVIQANQKLAEARQYLSDKYEEVSTQK